MINRSFADIEQLLSKLYSNRTLLMKLYNYRKRVDFYYDHALEFASEGDIELLIEYGVIIRDVETLELDNTYLHFFEDVMRSSEEINNATVEENIQRLQKYIHFYQEEQNNPENQRRHLYRIRTCLKTIGSLVKNNINAIAINIDDVYKTAGSYKIKKERLEDYLVSIGDIKDLIHQTRDVMKQEDSTFRVIIPDDRLLHIIADLQNVLNHSFNTIINLEGTIRDYLHQIEVQSKTLKKIRKLKQLFDEHTIEADTNIGDVLDERNPLWVEKQRRNHIHPSIAFLSNTDEGTDILELAKKQIQTKSSTKRKQSPPLSSSELVSIPYVEDYIDTDKLALSFMATGDDLFNYVINYAYDSEQNLDQKLEYYAEIVQAYFDKLVFTGEWRSYNNINYPLIYAQ